MQSFQSLCNLNAAAVPHIRFTFPFVSQHKAAACTLQVPLDYRLMLLPMPPHVTRVTRMTWIQTIKNSSSNTDICPQSPLQSADWCATLSTPPSLHYDARATSAGLLRGTIRTTSGWVQADGRATCSTLLLLELTPPPFVTSGLSVPSVETVGTHRLADAVICLEYSMLYLGQAG